MTCRGDHLPKVSESEKEVRRNDMGEGLPVETVNHASDAAGGPAPLALPWPGARGPRGLLI